MMCSVDPDYVSQDLAWNRPVLAAPAESDQPERQGIPAWAWAAAAAVVLLVSFSGSGGKERQRT